jgi:predicted nucleic acid-binding protein
MALTLYGKLLKNSLVLVQVRESDFDTASRYVDNVTLGLRGGDALHLAVSHAHGLTLATLDKRLAEAGIQLGAPTLLL